MRADFDWQGLLAEWFADTRENPDAIRGRLAYWYQPDADRDARLAARYGAALEAAAEGDWGGLEDDPQGRLALTVLLDQLPRNIHRGSARAFATDAQALALCLDGHDLGHDRACLPVERAFAWMPLQHAESLELQELGVDLFSGLADEDPPRAGLWDHFAGFAREHRDLIARFGRFPHRNGVLGRESTPAEMAYLEQGGRRFGQ